jgi:hypothetical protein
MAHHRLEDSVTKKSALRLAFEALPFYDFLENAWLVVRKPEITDENLDKSSLRYAGHNFIASLFLVTTVAAFIQYLLPQLFEIGLGQLINPVYLSLVLAVHAVVFAFILSIVSSVALLPQKPAFHHLIAHQVIQVYSILNLLVVVMFWVGINRILKTGNMQSASSSLDLWLGGGIGVLALYLGWRLLVRPLWNYTARYYTKGIALGITAIVLVTSLSASSYAAFGFGDLVINKSAFCKQLYEGKKKRGELESSVDEQCFIGHCIGLKVHKP